MDPREWFRKAREDIPAEVLGILEGAAHIAHFDVCNDIGHPDDLRILRAFSDMVLGRDDEQD